MRSHSVIIDSDQCKGCGLCIDCCPKKILKFSDSLNSEGFNYSTCVQERECIGCCNCALFCPDCCITIERIEHAG